jgi:hypothetical protein
LQFANRAGEILQHDTLPSLLRGCLFPLPPPFMGRANEGPGFKAAVRTHFRRKNIKNWYEWSDKRPFCRALRPLLFRQLGSFKGTRMEGK